ncbi:hypothetical protein B0H11DRAFT_170831 [Mycena galericulata]|nr:hypothetical protein B0H11DRAFT_170831 [Mycena galericulata]
MVNFLGHQKRTIRSMCGEHPSDSRSAPTTCTLCLLLKYASSVSLFRVRQLVPSTASDPKNIPEIGDVEGVLSRAFTNDLFTAVVTAHDPKDSDTKYIGPFWTSTIVAGLLRGEVWGRDRRHPSQDHRVCRMVWTRPHHVRYQYPLTPLMTGFNEELQTWWHSAFLPKYDAFVTSVLGEGTEHNSWHLQTLPVDPKYQRTGAAKILVNTIIETAAATKTPLCVESSTEANNEVYTKLGFHIMPKDHKGGPDDCKIAYTGVKGDGVPTWVLARD